MECLVNRLHEASTKTLLQGRDASRGSTLLAFHENLLLCDDNGITVPDWGRSEVVFENDGQRSSLS